MPPFTAEIESTPTVKWDNRYVAGISKVGALKRTTEVVEHRDGGNPSSSGQAGTPSSKPSRSTRGGPWLDFEQWAR